MPAITLDEDGIFLEFEIHGHKFQVDAYAAHDRLAAIDRAHERDPEWLDARGKVQPSQLFLDDVAALIVETYGAPRCGRPGASQFYLAVTRAIADVQKKTTPTPESPTGLAESTLGTGPNGESAPG